MIFTTSYKTEGMSQLITSLVKIIKPKKIIEFGTQQGHSAILLARGTKGKVYTYDSFKESYSKPPYKHTYANLEKTKKNTAKYNIYVIVKDIFKVKPINCDILHIDICNHYENILPLLKSWDKKVKKAIFLEGGVYNKWQKKYGFKPFNPILDLMTDWNYCIIKGDNGYAITIMTRK